MVDDPSIHRDRQWRWHIFLQKGMSEMTIKFFKPSDPRLFKSFPEEYIRDHFKIDSIEQLDGDPSAYFVLKFKDALSEKTKDFSIVVKHKNFFREHFVNYNDALEVINRVKGK